MGRKKKFSSIWLGPFEINAWGDKATDQDGEKMDASDWTGVNYRLKLPESMKRVYPIFHVSLLRKYVKPNEKFPKRKVNERPDPVIIEGLEYFEIEAILRKRTHYQKTQYLVQWKGYGREEADWLPYDPIVGWESDQWIVDEFEKSLVKGPVTLLTKAYVRTVYGTSVVGIERYPSAPSAETRERVNASSSHH